MDQELIREYVASTFAGVDVEIASQEAGAPEIAWGDTFFSYDRARKLARRVVVIAVADAGVGFRHSLESTQAKRFGERWGDAAALEAALIQGVSRFRDPGRGQGLAGIRRYLARWEGKVAIRSGTARIAIVPRWDDDVPLKDGLPAFPGSQVLLIIPEQEAK